MTIEQLYSDLMAGAVYCEPVTCVRDPFYWECLHYDGCKYLCWRHYGSSANSADMDGLRFILDKIFCMSPGEFVDKYTRFNDMDEYHRNAFSL